ncbi:unnamed protein product [Hapterophycus canaliculatus]
MREACRRYALRKVFHGGSESGRYALRKVLRGGSESAHACNRFQECSRQAQPPTQTHTVTEGRDGLESCVGFRLRGGTVRGVMSFETGQMRYCAHVHRGQMMQVRPDIVSLGFGTLTPNVTYFLATR